MQNIWKKIKTHRLKLFLVLFVLIGLLFPQGITLAQQSEPSWLRTIFNTIIGAGSNSFANTLLAIPHALSVAFAGVSMLIFTWVTGPNFISISYTGSDNPAISAGWPLIRDLANIMVVLFLLWIGLATALKWEEYQAQKKLVPLIFAAILINFSPVICGLFIDISNLIMNFLLSGLTGWDAFLNKAAEILPNFNGGLEGVQNGMELLIAMILNFAGGFAFLLFGVLLIARHIALWFLVILSPLAFVCNIFPATKRMFTQWYQQFSHWCIVGITSSFFLYLANQIFTNVTSLTPNTNNTVLDTAFPYLIPIIFLYIGLTAALATSAMGANVIISEGKKLGKQASQYTYNRNSALNKEILNRSGVSQGIKNLGNRTQLNESTGNKLTDFRNKLINRTNKTIAPLAKGIGYKATESDQKRFEKKTEEASKRSFSENSRDWHLLNSEEKAARFAGMNEEQRKKAKEILGIDDKKELELRKIQAEMNPDSLKKIIAEILPLIGKVHGVSGKISDDAIREFSKGLSKFQKEKTGLNIALDELQELTGASKTQVDEFISAKEKFERTKNIKEKYEETKKEKEEKVRKLTTERDVINTQIADTKAQMTSPTITGNKKVQAIKTESKLQKDLLYKQSQLTQATDELAEADRKLTRSTTLSNGRETEYQRLKSIIKASITPGSDEEKLIEKLEKRLGDNKTKVQEIFVSLKAEQIQNINIDKILENNEDLQKSMAEKWTGDQFKALAKVNAESAKKYLAKGLAQISKDMKIEIEDLPEKINASLDKYLKSTAAASLGITHKDIVRIANEIKRTTP